MNLNYIMDKLLVILGPTAAGKTKFAVKLAAQFSAEIISADSRQIYKEMDIGTGKDLNEYKHKNKTIPYHLIDILSPEKDYSVYQFKNDFFNTYDKISKKNKVSILCGGTGLYIESVLLNYVMPHVGPDKNLRDRLEKSETQELIDYLIELDASKYEKEFHITKRRLIRTIEIIESEMQNLPSPAADRNIDNPLILGLKVDRDEVLKKIKSRLIERLENGMIDEVNGLIKKGMSLERLNYFGLEYKFIGQYLFEKIKYDKMVELLNIAINQFSKRQMSFFRRMEKRGLTIHWIKPDELSIAKELVSQYL